MKVKRLSTLLAVVCVLAMNTMLFASDQLNLGDGLLNSHFTGNQTAIEPFLIPAIDCSGGDCYLANGSASGTGHLQGSGTYQIYSTSSAPFFLTHQNDGTFKITQTNTIYFNYSSQAGNLTGQLSFGTITATDNQLIWTIVATLTHPGGSYARYFPDGGKVTISMQAIFPLSILYTVNGFSTAEFESGTVIPARHCGNNDHRYWSRNQRQWQSGHGLNIGGNHYSDDQVESMLQASEYNDASMYLVHRLIGAMLNVNNGSKQDPIQTYIDDANTLLGNAQLPQQVDPNSPLGQQMLGDAAMLDSYNSNYITTAASH